MYYYTENRNYFIKFFQLTFDQDRFTFAFISELELDRKIRNQIKIFNPEILNRLVENTDTRLVITSTTEIASPESLNDFKDKLIQEQIPLNRVHFIAVSEIQKTLVENTVPAFMTSVFNHWEYVTAIAVKKWSTKIETALPHKKFLYLNRRFTLERGYVFYNLWQDKKFVENVHASMHTGQYWQEVVDINYYRRCLKEHAQYYPQWQEMLHFYDKIKYTLPRLEPQDPKKYDIFGIENNTIAQAFKKTDVSIIVESHPIHGSYGFMPTEKTYRAIAGGQPFIVLSVEHYYKNLVDQGYLLDIPEFDNVDTIVERAEQFVEYIKQLLDDKNWKRFLKKQRDYTEHNKNNLYRRVLKKEVVKRFHPELAQHVRITNWPNDDEFF